MRGIVDDFRQRAEGDLQLEALWATVMGKAPPTLRVRAVGANVLALLSWGTPTDAAHLRTLSLSLGDRALASVQEQVLATIDTEERRPLTTAFVRRLRLLAWDPDLDWSGMSAEEAASLRATCGEGVVRLLMLRDDADPVAPVLASVSDILGVFTEGDVPQWRRLVADAAADPWNGVGAQHLELLAGSHHPRETAILRATLDLARRFIEDDERRTVADHIRQTIARTGLTQREFAGLLGTSPSRLSTYATGAVTPSATMLLRINRVAKRAQAGSSGEFDDEPA